MMSPRRSKTVALPEPHGLRTAVITGGSAGIGAEIARVLVERGHGVTLVARRADRLASTAAAISRRGIRVETIVADMSDPQSRAALVESVRDKGLHPHILVNNAGSATSGAISSAEPGAELAMVEVDVAAVVDLCTRVVPGMVERGVGAVLNTSSTGAFAPVPGQVGYGASKAFVLSYSHGLSAELRGTGVTCTVVCPGPVPTGFGQRAGVSDAAAAKSLPTFLWKSPAYVAEAAVKGLEAGDLTVIPGVGNRIGAMVANFVPRSLLLPVLARTSASLPRTTGS